MVELVRLPLRALGVIGAEQELAQRDLLGPLVFLPPPIVGLAHRTLFDGG